MNHAALPGALAAYGAIGILVAAVIIFAVSVSINICMTWLVSRIVTPSTGTFRNAIRHYWYMVLLIFGMIAAAAILGIIIMSARGHGGGNAGLSGIAVILGILIFAIAAWGGLIGITMNVYDIGILRALGFHFVSFILGMSLSIGLNLVTGTMLPRQTIEARQARTEEFTRRLTALIEHKALPTPAQQSPDKTPASAPTPALTLALSPSPARLPAQPRGTPSEVALTAPVQIAVMIDGRNAGDVTLQPGALVKLLSVEGDQLKIQYMDTVTTIPRKSTDFPGTP